MTNNKSEIRSHLERLFKRFRPKKEVPTSLKEDVFETLENLNFLDDSTRKESQE
jgi:hypothetical protein